MSECFGAPFITNGFLSLNQSQLSIYKKGWDDFNRIQSYNSNVSTLRSEGNKKLTYYTYISYAERQSFRTGQFLHQQEYPTVSWNSIQEN
jgi:hypothetical protein